MPLSPFACFPCSADVVFCADIRSIFLEQLPSWWCQLCVWKPSHSINGPTPDSLAGSCCAYPSGSRCVTQLVCLKKALYFLGETALVRKSLPHQRQPGEKGDCIHAQIFAPARERLIQVRHWMLTIPARRRLSQGKPKAGASLVYINHFMLDMWICWMAGQRSMESHPFNMLWPACEAHLLLTVFWKFEVAFSLIYR